MDKLKKLAKALAKERNIPYQTAHNILTGHGSRPVAPAVPDEAATHEIVRRIEEMIIECWGQLESWWWHVETYLSDETGRLTYRVTSLTSANPYIKVQNLVGEVLNTDPPLEVTAEDPDELLRRLNEIVPARIALRPISESRTPRPAPRIRDNVLTALRAAATDGPSFTPVMTGVPISLRVRRENDGRYFVECNVSPFSSPFLVVQEDREAALEGMAATLLVLLKELKTRGGPFVSNNPLAPSKASFDFDGRYFEVEEATWLEAHEKLKRLQVRVAGYIERLAGLRRIRAKRYVQARCDYETSDHAGAGGVFQVIELKEGDHDVTNLVDQGIHFSSIMGLQKHLSEVTGDEVEVEEVG